MEETSSFTLSFYCAKPLSCYVTGAQSAKYQKKSLHHTN